MTGFLHSDITGWGLAASLIAGFVFSISREWIVLRKTHARLVGDAVAAEAAKVSAETAKTAAEATKTDFYREAHRLERERNEVLMGGLVTIVTEIRRAVADPDRRPTL